MTQENRYPSPEPGNANSVHPYHSGQQQASPDLSQQLQHHAPTAMMHDQAAQDGSGPIPPGFQYVAQYGAPQPNTPQHLAQQGLDVDGGQTDPSAKKKSKVSRACDECRRKKVYSCAGIPKIPLTVEGTL